jgi:protein-tyrosine phosphatase
MNGSPPLWPSEYHYHTEHMMDDDPYSLLKNMVKICSFMRQAVLDGCNVLVHSSRGANRSGSMVIGFLMLQENLSYVKALSATREARACVSPRAGFVVQLLTWENILKLWKAGKQGKALQLPPIKDMHLHLPPINGL